MRALKAVTNHLPLIVFEGNMTRTSRPSFLVNLRVRSMRFACKHLQDFCGQSNFTTTSFETGSTEILVRTAQVEIHYLLVVLPPAPISFEGKPPPPPSRQRGRNCDWGHLFNRDVISMPDKWEYPWYAVWDLGTCGSP